MAKQAPPSVNETAFNCPHCGAFTTQYWYHTFYQPMKDNQTPTIWRHEDVERMVSFATPEQKADEERFFGLLASGVPYLSDAKEGEYGRTIFNLTVSRCYACGKLAIWVYDRLIYPAMSGGPQPNSDLPDDIAKDYREAGAILSLSPRGAAALLRLCVQKLCIHLGMQGKSIDNDIAELVAGGLDPRIQKALDAVRVIGNNAVHPGKMNVGDNPDVALRLFDLVNIIAERMISHPKHVDAAYESLPEGAKAAIEKRDKPKPGAT